ncbi:hypothetical protein AGMMS49525_15370 [Bacteroidia bacterium]|nr:hypothetical protein AGMMS49525_15370 [Bacteroidia bacterium]
MKRVLKSVAVLAIAVVTSCLFTSCSKDDDAASLKGTSWLYEAEEVVDNVLVGVAIELDFTTASQVDLNVLVGGKSDDAIVISGVSAGTYSYSYNHPAVTITVDGDRLTGTVNGNKLTLSDGADVWVGIAN